jgi:hypothetical protein
VEGIGAEALRGLNAALAAVDALRATFPSKTGPQEAAELIESLEMQIYGKDGRSGEWGLLVEGRHPAEVLLRQTSPVAGATSFWQDEPTYGTEGNPDDTNPQLLPVFSRLSKW